MRPLSFLSPIASLLGILWISSPSAGATAPSGHSLGGTIHTNLATAPAAMVSDKRLRSRRRRTGRGRRRVQEEIIHTVENTSTLGGGPFPVTGTTVTTVLPEGLQYDNASTPRGSCEAQASGSQTNVVCNLGTVNANETFELSIFFTPIVTGSYMVNSSIVTNEFDPDPANNSTTISFEVDPAPSTVTGQKYEDLNGNGQKDPNEVGLNDWTIALVSETNVRTEQTTADVDLNSDGQIDPSTERGIFVFNDVTAGAYLVEEVAQEGWAAGTASMQEISVAEEQEVIGIDFGNYRPPVVTGRKFEDLNGNVRYDDGEPLIEGWQITLIGENGLGESVSITATSGADGTFSFEGLRPGTYSIDEEDREGWKRMPAPEDMPPFEDPGVVSVDLRSGDSNQIIFANYRPPSITGRKFHDIDGDAVDEVETTLGGWTFDLTGTDGQGREVSRRTTTNSEGLFSFFDLLPGRYTVTEEEREGWVQSRSFFDAFFELDLRSNDAVENADFWNYQPGSIHGVKFRDDDGDGVQDEGEPGLSGWTITLTGTDNQGNAVSLTTTTGTNGAFNFLDLAPGTYTVSEVGQSGWTRTAPASGTHTISLSSGQAVEGRDFGNRPDVIDPSDVPGQKYLDADGDGVRDEQEAGVDGVLIQLVQNGQIVAQTRTSSTDVNGDGVVDPISEQGLFTFADVQPGTYSVREVVHEGWRQSDPAGGTGHEISFTSGQTVSLLLFGNDPGDGELDWGDLPDPRLDLLDPCPATAFSCYETLAASFGAAHVLGGDVWLGAVVDGDPDGQPNATADGDDVLDGNDDEDGINSITIQDGRIIVDLVATVNPPTTQAFVDAWVDMNDDGEFGPGEHILFSEPVTNGPNTLTSDPTVTPLPPGARLGYSRFRISTSGGLIPFGIAADGEVEDYFLFGLDFGDAPDADHPDFPEIPAGYPTTLPQDGARHVASSIMKLGEEIDADPRGLPDLDALGDDEENIADEDGIVFDVGFVVTAVIPNFDLPGGFQTRYGIPVGQTAGVIPLPSMSGMISAWIDWNRDGDWEDDGEQIITDVQIAPEADPDPILFQVPSDASIGATFARFRFSRFGGLGFTGPAIDGEVEDYIIDLLRTTVVTSTADGSDTNPGDGICDDGTGQCSLRAAIEEANATEAPDRIEFDGAGKRHDVTVTPQSPLPTITSAVIIDGEGGLTIDGSSAGAGADGLTLTGGSSLVTGVTMTGFAGHGIVISGEGGNRIESSVVTSNGGDGVRILSGTGNRISLSRIDGNGGLGIDLGGDGVTLNDPADADSGPNNGQNFPEISAATAENRLVKGSLSGAADESYALEFFASADCDPSGYGEGGRLVGRTNVVLDAQGASSFEVVLDSTVTIGEHISATATAEDGSTSEFAACMAAVTTAAEPLEELPASFRLYPNYPNPFNPETQLLFDVASTEHVRLIVYDLLGKQVRTLIDEPRNPGRHRAVWDGTDSAGRAVSTGAYVIRLEAGSYRDSRLVVFVK